MNTTYRTIAISDVHLGTRDCKAEKLNNFLKNNSCNTLYLVGDIIDAWRIQQNKWRWKQSHTNVVRRILGHAKRGTRVVYIAGNHDEFLHEFMGKHFGGIEIREDYVLDIRNTVESYYIFHGDVIDIFITKYKWLSKIGAVGYDFALWLNRWYNKYRVWRKLPYQSISQKIKSGVKAATNYVNDFEVTALSMATKKGCHGVMCGHIHQPEDRMINGKRYLNSGDWVENMTAICVEDTGRIYLYS